MGLTTRTKRSELKRLYRDAKRAGVGLKSAIEQISDKVSEQSFDSRGSTVIRVSGNGADMQWQASDGINQTDYVDLFDHLDDLFDDCRADLVTTDADDADAAVYDEMLDRLKPVRSSYADWSGTCLA